MTPIYGLFIHQQKHQQAGQTFMIIHDIVWCMTVWYESSEGLGVSKQIKHSETSRGMLRWKQLGGSSKN